jgi:pSer/pThr/pTyr-binding forkhead associated (FHA) protein/outer membrane protein assembly factor BamD (BamD/ComL family)
VSKLVCTAGPKAGSEFPLTGETLVIGRAVEVEISIPDTSVSRRHLEIRKLGNGWVVQDLGSGNGTELNGNKITEEVPIRNGDVLTLGDTELSFVDDGQSTGRHALPVRRSSGAAVPVSRRATGGNSAPVRPVSRRQMAPDPAVLARRKKIKIIAGAAAGVLLILFFVGNYFHQKSEAVRLANARKHQAALQHVSEIFQEGTSLVREGNWIEAQKRFETVAGIKDDYPELKDYLERAKKEIPNQQLLDEADKAIAAGSFADAAEKLSKVSKDTLLSGRLNKTRDMLEEKVPARVSEARAAYDEKNYEQAIAITADVLKAFPDSRDAKLLNEDATKADYAVKHPPPPPPPPPARPWEAVIARYTQGDLTGAVAMANACSAKGFSRCKTLLRQMGEFAKLNKRAESLKTRDLKRLITLDREISEGKGSTLAKSAAVRAGNILYQCATSAKATGNWGRAADCANQAIAMDPRNSGAQAIAAEAQSHAKDVYMIGYAAKDTNPDEAISRFREVLSMTPPSNEYHQKAQNWLEKLQR